jgi:hypothetical protein
MQASVGYVQEPVVQQVVSRKQRIVEREPYIASTEIAGTALPGEFSTQQLGVVAQEEAAPIQWT